MYELCLIVLVLIALAFVVKFARYIVAALILAACLYVVLVVGKDAGTISDLASEFRNEIIGRDEGASNEVETEQ